MTSSPTVHFFDDFQMFGGAKSDWWMYTFWPFTTETRWERGNNPIIPLSLTERHADGYITYWPVIKSILDQQYKSRGHSLVSIELRPMDAGIFPLVLAKKPPPHWHKIRISFSNFDTVQVTAWFSRDEEHHATESGRRMNRTQMGELVDKLIEKENRSYIPYCSLFFILLKQNIPEYQKSYFVLVLNGSKLNPDMPIVINPGIPSKETIFSPPGDNYHTGIFSARLGDIESLERDLLKFPAVIRLILLRSRTDFLFTSRSGPESEVGVVCEEWAPEALMRSRVFHNLVFDICLGLAVLRMPPYVLLEIIDWFSATEYVTRLRKITAIERMHHSIKRCYEKRKDRM